MRWKEGERWGAPMVREAEEGEGEVGSTDGEGSWKKEKEWWVAAVGNYGQERSRSKGRR